jgi:DNA polymerase I-like protein with 3'-5' exonuclease and polymerase domains
MQDYCEVDVAVTKKLLGVIISHFDGTSSSSKGIPWDYKAVELEHRVWSHCLRQEERGYGYDLVTAAKLTGELKNRQSELELRLIKEFGSWWEAIPPTGVTYKDYIEKGERPAIDREVLNKDQPIITYRRFSEKTGKELKPYAGHPKTSYSTDAPFCKVRFQTFNPKSRQHLGDRLQDVFGWKPIEFGGADGTQAKIDETTIKDIDTAILPEELKDIILEYLVISKTLGQMADGRKSWNDLCSADGRIHARMDPLGTVSHRAAHKDPNLGQVPSVSTIETKDANGVVISKQPIMGWRGGFGAECRSLFRPGVKGWSQTGSDASGLELRLLGHYLYPFDNGEFAKRVSTPGLDIHAENAKVTGLSRAQTKTVTYAYIYGAGNWKLGFSVGCTDEEFETLPDSGAARSYMRWVQQKKLDVPSRKDLAFIVKGSEVKKKFQEGITGLKELQAELKAQAEAQGFIIAIDGRKLYVRKAHAVLNQMLQGGGAVICKMWMLKLQEQLEDLGLTYGTDFAQMAWVHDEVQYEHKDRLSDAIRVCSEAAMVETATDLDFKGSLSTDSKTGSNWFDCH